MILQALNEYYERLADDPELAIPRYGFGSQKIHFALVLDREGILVQVKDLRETVKNKPFPVSLTVPTIARKRAVNIEPNFMWDNTGYVLGRDQKGNQERTLKCFDAFRGLHHALCDTSEDPGVRALLRFLDSHKPDDAPAMTHWGEMEGSNLVFQLDGERGYLHDRPAVREIWINHCAAEESHVIATCLIKGEPLPIARLHPAIRGVQGAQSSGASVVSLQFGCFFIL